MSATNLRIGFLKYRYSKLGKKKTKKKNRKIERKKERNRIIIIVYIIEYKKKIWMRQVEPTTLIFLL